MASLNLCKETEVDAFDEAQDVLCSQQQNNHASDESDSERHLPAFVDAPDTNNAEPAAEDATDPVHRCLRLHQACDAFVATRQFARLANLRQLGLAKCKFAAAEHTRFPHSLGVSHLASRLMTGLQERSRESLTVTPRDVRNVAIAGLCHDLGHGPLSHVFEREFLRRAGIRGWEHEKMSIKMLKYLIEDNKIEGFFEQDLEDIKGLIEGLKPEERQARGVPPGKGFIFDIVSNDHNGIDVDRMDYLQRDALQSGKGQLARDINSDINSDINALIGTAEVVGDQVCYPLSQRVKVWNVFRQRVRMFREVYLRSEVKAAEIMAAEALVQADVALQFSRHVHDAKEYMCLSDSLLQHIEHYPVLCAPMYEALPPAERRSLDGARALLQRLGRGELYPCCGACEVPEEVLVDREREKTIDSLFTAEDVAACGARHGLGVAAAGPGAHEAACPGGSCEVAAAAPAVLTAGDLILDDSRITYAKGGSDPRGRDPMASVGFFDDRGPGPRVKVNLTPEQLEELPDRPSCFKIRTLRVYVREARHVEAAARAFRAWCCERLGVEAANVPGAQTAVVAAARAPDPADTAARGVSAPEAAPASPAFCGLTGGNTTAVGTPAAVGSAAAADLACGAASTPPARPTKRRRPLSDDEQL